MERELSQGACVREIGGRIADVASDLTTALFHGFSHCAFCFCTNNCDSLNTAHVELS